MRNSVQFLSRWSCNQLRFHRDFSVICQCKRQCTSISQTKAVRLLKSETATQSHRISWVVSQTAAINCTKIVLKSQLVYMCDFEVACNFSATKIALSCPTRIACVNGPLFFVCLITNISLLRDLRNTNSLEIDFHPSNSTSSFYGIFGRRSTASHSPWTLYGEKYLTIISVKI